MRPPQGSDGNNQLAANAVFLWVEDLGKPDGLRLCAAILWAVGVAGGAAVAAPGLARPDGDDDWPDVGGQRRAGYLPPVNQQGGH